MTSEQCCGQVMNTVCHVNRSLDRLRNSVDDVCVTHTNSTVAPGNGSYGQVSDQKLHKDGIRVPNEFHDEWVVYSTGLTVNSHGTKNRVVSDP